MKKIFRSIVVFMFVMAVPCFVKAAGNSEPTYVDGDYPVFYANGTAITIEKNSDENTIVTYDDKSVVISSKTTVFGGGVAGTSFDSSSIIMKDGTVAAIFGGGDGSPTSEAKVGQATIKIIGGNVVPIKKNGAYVKGTVSGGGVLYSSVDKVSIDITGGTVFTVLGGGLSSSEYNGVKSDAGTKADPEASKNRTGDVVINISGGVINSSANNYGLVFGGGQGYSYVNNSVITISGNADLSKAWIVAGGSNGRTDDGTININGGTINTVQTINRGSMKNARVNMTAGTVQTMFVGGEDPEKFDNDIVNGGFLGNIILDITGGKVTNLKLGSNYDAAIPKDASYAKVFYEPTCVMNSADLIETFGTVANPYEEKQTVIENLSVAKIISTDLLAALKETNNVYKVSVGEKYNWIFKGSNIVDATIPVNTAITFTADAPEEIKAGVDSQIADLKLNDVSFLNFAHEGKLPGKANVSYDVSGLYEDGITLFVWHYNEATGKLENAQEIVVTDGKILIEIETCSSYVLTTGSTVESRSLEEEQQSTTDAKKTQIDNPQTADANIIMLIIMIVISAGGFAITKKRISDSI